MTMDLNELNKAMKEAFARLGDRVKDIGTEQLEMRSQLLDLAQAGARMPIGSLPARGASELTNILVNSEGLEAFLKGTSTKVSVEVPGRLLYRNAITSTAPGVNDPLRQPDRSRGIVVPPEQRLTIRGLFTQIPTGQGSIEVVQEASFSSNAAIQGNDASPTGSGEGARKAESQMTFTLSALNIPTIAHWIHASRQILSDAPRLQAHVEGRLLYGLALEEEEQMLTGTGAGLGMNGINNQATAFNGGVTNATALDTLARAINQLQLANCEPSGIVLHPNDWLAIKLLKDTQGRYLIGDPAAQTMPVLWGLPVVPTVSQTLGKFTVVDARQAGYVADRENATVRISENVNDDFVRNLVTLLAEERALIVIERPTAIVYGNLSHTG
jgi:HK97 family phage major capsid protein